MAADYYRRKYPGEAATDVLRAQLDLSGPGDLAAQAASLRQRIETDFAQQDIELVSGWMFARTELRLCLLMTLLGEAR